MRRVLATAAGLLLAAAPPAARAQAVGGRVVETATRRPLPGVPVRLLRAGPGDTAAVATGETSAEGAFLLMAPGTGAYRVGIGAAFVGPVLALAAADSLDQREYQMAAAEPAAPAPADATPADATPAAAAPAGAARVYDEKEVDRKARLQANASPQLDVRSVLEGGGSPPAGKTRWDAVVEAVVGPGGRAEMGSTRVVSATTVDFGAAAERYVITARFAPALVAGLPVRQRVRVPVQMLTTTRVEVRRF